MKRTITLLSCAVLAFSGSLQAQETNPEAPTGLTQGVELNIKPQSYAQTKNVYGIWGAEGWTGVAEGQFQSSFVNSTNGSSFDPSNWTALSVYESDGATTPGAAYWTQTMTGEGQGLFYGSGPLNSPTQANGSAIFDSDYLDNGGVNFGSGTSPGMHEGWLVSPRIDLSGYTDTLVGVKFFCKMRLFNVPNFTVSFSVDDGATWVETPIGSELYAPQGIENEGWVRTYFPQATAGVTNLTQCRIRFRFEGYYYHALIDDVTVETAPDLDLQVGADDYSAGTFALNLDQVQLMNNRHIPISGIEYPRDFTYGINVKNRGVYGVHPIDSPHVRAIVEKNVTGVWTEVYRDSTIIPILPSMESVFVVDTLGDDSWVSTGDFRVIYDIYTPFESITNNNTITHEFSINDDSYTSKVDLDVNGNPYSNAIVFPGGNTFTNFEMGATYSFPEAGTNEMSLDSMSQAFYVTNNYSGSQTVVYSSRFYEWNDVNNDSIIDGTSELTLVALGTDTLFNVGAVVPTYIYGKTAMYDVNTFQSGFNLSDNRVYVASTSLRASENGLTEFTAGNMLWMGCVDDKNYGMNFGYTGTRAHYLLLEEPGGVETYNEVGFGVTRVPSIGLHLGEACYPLTADMSFVEDYLDVDFTDISTSTPAADSWSWDFGDGNTSTDQDPSHTYASAGQYIVCLTATNACSSDTICDTINATLNTTGLVGTWMDNVVVYPMPAANVVNVKNLPSGQVAIKLQNLVGQIVYEKSFDTNEEIQVSVQDYASGHYNLTIETDTGVLVKRVVIR